MATPDDGMSPRMQVFLWTGEDTRTMSLSSGRMPAMGGAVFGPKDFDVTAEVVLGTDGAGANPTDGCTALTNAITGKLVIVDRGNCTFKTKTLNVQNAGGVGVIVANNIAADTPPSLGDDATITTPITIPAVSVTQDEGAATRTDLAAGPLTAMIHREVGHELDGALDATLIAHEFGHYLHHADMVELKVTYQGCADAGLCYPPTTKVVSVALPPPGTPSAAQAAAGGAGRARQWHVGVELTVVHLDLAEEFVGLLLAVRQPDLAERESRGPGLHCDPVPVQVVAVGDRPVEGDGVCAVRVGGEPERLVRREELVLARSTPQEPLGARHRRQQAGQRDQPFRYGCHDTPDAGSGPPVETV